MEGFFHKMVAVKVLFYYFENWYSKYSFSGQLQRFTTALLLIFPHNTGNIDGTDGNKLIWQEWRSCDMNEYIYLLIFIWLSWGITFENVVHN